MLKYSHKSLVFISLLVILLADLQFIFHKNEEVNDEVYQKIEQQLQWLIDLSRSQSQHILQEISDSNEESDELLTNSISIGQENQIEWAVSFDGELIFWSGNVVPFEWQDLKQMEEGIHFIGNGWHYLTISRGMGGHEVYGFVQIMSKYSHQNEHLRNRFHDSFDQAYKGTISSLPIQGYSLFPRFETANPVYLKLEKDKSDNTWWMNVLRMLELIFLFVFVVSIYRWMKDVYFAGHSETTSPLVAVVLVLTVRSIGLFFGVPKLLYSMDIFGPQVYASSFLFPSLGDLVLNVFALFFLALIFYKHFNIPQKLQSKQWFIAAVIIFMFAFCVWHIYLASTLFKNSSLSLDLSQLLWFDFSSILLVMSLVIITISVFLWLIKILQILADTKFSAIQTVVLFVGIVVLSILFGMDEHGYHPIPIALTFLSLMVLLVIRRLNKESLSIPAVVIIVLMMSAMANIVLINESHTKEISEREFLAKKLSLKQDPIAEYLLREHLKSMQNDFEIRQLCSSKKFDKNKLTEYIKARYFQGFWDKYRVMIEVCGSQDTSFKSSTELMACRQKMASIQQNNSDEKDPPQINVSTGEGKVEYISTIRFVSQNLPADTVDIMLSFESKFIREEKGYPELLLGQEQIDQTVDLNYYAYARYEGGNLVAQQGNYKYEISLENVCSSTEFIHYDEHEYSHMLYCTGDSIIVLSKPEDSVFSWLTSYSYLAALFSLVLLFMGVVIVEFPLLPNIKFKEFTVRIQMFIVLFIFTLTGVFGYITSGYVKDKYLEKNELQISEKMKSVLIEMEHKLGDQETLEQPSYRYIESLLVKFSNVFNSDINMYDLKGMLIGSSRSKIFDKKLLGRRMDAYARHALLVEKRSEFIHEEHIGDLQYLAVYVPFRNVKGKVLAYLSLPSFAKQNELEKEVGAFITTILNIYVFILAISVLVALLFANYLAKPLMLIREKIKDFRLEEKNELLDWQADDEIGELVKEYNKMVIELEKSVQKLAKSEREGAWQEMARQVAHEIKNPLTPMKLNIQLLQRASEDNQPGLKEQLDKTAKSLIHEIDNLSRIASEFSRFAGSAPVNENAQCDLALVIRQSIQLFAAQDLELKFDYPEQKSIIVRGDKKDLGSVITNILKNAIQAIPDDKRGKITITLLQKDQHAHVRIRDNGSGIPVEIQQDIFEPRFTTKTSGTGLGLPIVKRLIDQLGGSIAFTSEEHVGTEFEVFIPLLGEGDNRLEDAK